MKVTSRTPTLCLISTKAKASYEKKRATRVHFISRFRERVGEVISDAAYNRLTERVAQEGKFLYRKDVEGNLNASVYSISYGSLFLKVVYDPFKKSLITVLPWK